MLGAVICLTGCSAAFKMESPLGMSDEEFNQRVATLVNPSLAQLHQKYDALAAKVEPKDEETPKPSFSK